MHFAVMNGETIDFQRIKLLDLLQPGFVHAHLRIRFARRIHEIHLRVEEIDVANEGAVEKRAPLHRKINQRRGKEWDWHMAGRLYDLDMVNLVSAPPQMQSYGCDMTTILRLT